MNDDLWSPLRSELDGLSRTAKRGLNRTRANAILLAAAMRFLWTPAIVVGCWVVLQVLGRLTGSEALQTGWLGWLVAAVVAFALRVAFATRSAR